VCRCSHDLGEKPDKSAISLKHGSDFSDRVRQQNDQFLQGRIAHIVTSLAHRGVDEVIDEGSCARRANCAVAIDCGCGYCG
jgi:hypothetical protein